jgi:glycosyl transferase family 87
VLWAVLRAGGFPAGYAFAVVLSPAALENALVGQNGALITAALAGGLLLQQRWPVGAGALLGLLTIKPQLGLLVPMCLLARRSYRTITSTALSGLGYCGAGAIVFGLGVWQTYLTVTAPFVRGYIDAPFGLAAHYMMVPPFITMRAMGASLTLAYVLQALVSLLCMVLSYRVWSQRRLDQRLAIALVLCLAPLATPYAHSYDLIAVAAACAMLAKVAEERDGLYTPEWFMLFLAWTWPGSAFALGTVVAPGMGAFAVGMAALVALRLIRADAHSAQDAGQAIRPPGAG